MSKYADGTVVVIEKVSYDPLPCLQHLIGMIGEVEGSNRLNGDHYVRIGKSRYVFKSDDLMTPNQLKEVEDE